MNERMDVVGEGEGAEGDYNKKPRGTESSKMDVVTDDRKPLYLEKYLEDWEESDVFDWVRDWNAKTKKIMTGGANFPQSGQDFPNGVAISVALTGTGNIANLFASMLGVQQESVWSELQESFEDVPSKPLINWSKGQVYDCVNSWNDVRKMIQIPDLSRKAEVFPQGILLSNQYPARHHGLWRYILQGTW